MNTLRRRTLLSSDIITNDNSFDHSNYMTIEALEDLTVVSPRAVSYNIDGNGWNDNETTFNLKQGEFLSLKYNMTTGSTSFGTFQIDGACNLRGNCMSLVYGDNAKDETSLENYSNIFKKLFNNCTKLQNVSENFLPATTLAIYCYSDMFNGCTSLVTAPELPATTLYSSCYDKMFYNCTSLVTAPELPATTLAIYCYNGMFNGCTSLVTAPELPATTLASHCYDSMFYRCRSLVTAPELPATTLAIYCYNGMFSNCTSLVNAPELLSTKLASYCYHQMFYRCTSLVNAPELPATTLYSSCYDKMFEGCTSLVTAPELPATTLANYCYRYMLQNCTSLVTAPELPATTLASHCYSDMFNGCTSLVTAPELPATTLTGSCYSYMFYGCTSLVNAPELPATTLAIYCYSDMFNGCTSLVTAPELPATTLANYCYRYMFNGCKKLNYIKMLATDISASNCLYNWVYNVSSSGTFIKHPDMVSLPSGSSGIPRGWTVEDYSNEIDYSKEYFTIKALEDGLTASLSNNACEYRIDDGSWNSLSADTNTLSVNKGQTLSFKGNLTPNSSNGIGTFTISKKCNVYGNIMSLLYGDDFEGQYSLSGKSYVFTNLFYYCDMIINAENLILPATTLAIDCYDSMFQGCTSLVNAPELPATTLANRCYYRMFEGCTSLTTAPQLLATTLREYCYYYMFQGCTSLTAAPGLPATTLADGCYAYMFQGCSKLNYIKMLAIDIRVIDCLDNWVNGVASSGTFIKHPGMTSLPSGTSGIPNGWTVHDYTYQSGGSDY